MRDIVNAFVHSSELMLGDLNGNGPIYRSVERAADIETGHHTKLAQQRHDSGP